MYEHAYLTNFLRKFYAMVNKFEDVNVPMVNSRSSPFQGKKLGLVMVMMVVFLCWFYE